MQYWVGVVVGCATSLVFAVMGLLIVIGQNDKLAVRITQCEDEVHRLEQIVDDDRQIMKTYEFFNKEWEKLPMREDMNEFRR